MELQRHASILIRQSNELLQLTGKHDGGTHNDQAIREQIATMHTRLNDLAAQLTPKEVLQEQAFTLIEQAIKELGDEATPLQVQARLISHGIDLPIEQVSGNMKIVRDSIEGEWE